MVERQFDKKINTIRSDIGSEFLCITELFKLQGIIHETSCIGTLQENGRVEPNHWHILNIARALQFEAHLLIEFKRFCVLTAKYLINRNPSKILKGKTSFEMLYNKPTLLDHLLVMDCLCYVHKKRHGGDKFAPHVTNLCF